MIKGISAAITKEGWLFCLTDRKPTDDRYQHALWVSQNNTYDQVGVLIFGSFIRPDLELGDSYAR